MSISSAGLGSGLDVNSIVNQLMVVEAIPITKLQQNKTQVETDISAFGQLKSYLSAFKDSVASLKTDTDFISNSVTSSDDTIAKATVSKDAAAASYDITVTSLAQQHKLRSADFTDGSTVVGTGTLDISVGSSSFSVVIDSSNNTLADIKNAINSASDNTGVTASVITVDTGSKLVLTSDGLGSANAITVKVTNDGDGNNSDTSGLSQLVYDAGVTENLTQVDAATDAVFSIDGDTVTRSTNSIDDAITGVTLNLVAAGNATISITQNQDAAKTKLEGVVKAYNNLNGAIASLRGQGYSGDALLRNIEANVRNLFSNTPSSITGEIDSAIEAGFSFDKEGVLSLESDELDGAIKNNFNDLVNYFIADTDGFSNRLESLMDQYVGSGGVIDQKVEILTQQSSSIDDKIEQMNARLTQVEKRYRDQFTRLDVLMSQFNTTSSYLTSQLEQLSNLNKQIANN